MNLGFFTVMPILGVGVEASQGDKPIIAVLHVRDGTKEAYDCQTPLIFMARHDALSAIVCHRKDVLQGTGLMAAGYSNGLRMSIA